MTTERIATQHRWSASAWAGRASHHRREQVRRVPEPTANGLSAAVDELWDTLVGVLRTLDFPSSALLCTADGVPVMGYGLSQPELAAASVSTGRNYAAHGVRRPRTVETLELESGTNQTVIASVPAAGHSHVLLAVRTAGVSMPVLQAWTRQTADELRELLAAHS